MDAPPEALTETVHELYQSVLSTRRSAQQRLRMIQDIERRHSNTPLVALIDLAVTGALDHPTFDREDVFP